MQVAQLAKTCAISCNNTSSVVMAINKDSSDHSSASIDTCLFWHTLESAD